MKVGIARAGQQQRRVVQPGGHQTIRHRRQDRRGGHVAGYVRLGVVRAVLFLSGIGEVDVLLEDEPEDVGVDLIRFAGRTLIEMPAPRVEEVEQRLECAVTDLDVVRLLQFVRLEDAAVHIRHVADDALGLGLCVVAAVGRAAETHVEQRQQESLVERVEPVCAVVLAHHPQAAAQVVPVAVQEPLALDEVDEHDPVQQDRRVPTTVLVRSDPLHRRGEVLVVLLELPVERLGDSVGVERTPDSGEHRRGSQPVLLVEGETRLSEPLQQRFGRRRRRIPMIHKTVPDPAGPLLGPQPQVLIGRGKHHELVTAEPPQPPHDTVLLRTLRHAGGTVHPPGSHTPLAGDRHRSQVAAFHLHGFEDPGVVPAHAAKQRTEVTLPQQPRQFLLARQCSPVALLPLTRRVDRLDGAPEVVTPSREDSGHDNTAPGELTKARAVGTGHSRSAGVPRAGGGPRTLRCGVPRPLHGRRRRSRLPAGPT